MWAVMRGRASFSGDDRDGRTIIARIYMNDLLVASIPKRLKAYSAGTVRWCCHNLLFSFVMSATGKAYRLNSIPYGPAGIELIPKGFKKIIEAIHNIVETMDETRMND
jgi:hypothetical protein